MVVLAVEVVSVTNLMEVSDVDVVGVHFSWCEVGKMVNVLQGLNAVS